MRYLFEDIHPHFPSVRIDFVQLVEVGENKLIFRKAILWSRRQDLIIKNILRGLLVVIDKVAVRHVYCFLSVKRVYFFRRWNDLVSNNVVHEISGHWSTIPHVGYLNGSTPHCKNVMSAAISPSVQVEQNIYIILFYDCHYLQWVFYLRNINEYVKVLF